MLKILRTFCLGLLAVYGLGSCLAWQEPAAQSVSSSIAFPATASPTGKATLTRLPPTPTPFPTATPQPPTATPTLTLPEFYEPAGCRKPPDEYERVMVNGWQLNRRTLAMLEYAAELYRGKIDISGGAITQGSYHDNGAASFGTHLGGGAVDLSVIQLPQWIVLYDEIEPLIRALRVAGFAAWLRDFDEVYPGSPIHIHAIAVGDAQLSQPAIDQLSGPAGYFYGYSGLPSQGKPTLDRHGGPIVCGWMRELGYADLRPPERRQVSLAAGIADLEPGSLVDYRVQPGDILPDIAARFASSVTAIALQNGLRELSRLDVGQVLRVPVRRSPLP